MGSPPPMRGKDLTSIISPPKYRITPAYAGKSFSFLMSPFGMLGSPPPMRGKVFSNALCRLSFRITPAYAGKSQSQLAEKTGIKDHPRLCGEKMRRAFEKGYDKGSPPPMRGKDLPIVKPENVIRITPAYAGKSPALRQEFATGQDHPRLCGEKLAFSHLLTTILGSPPPMRGKGYYVAKRQSVRRITPAYAGKS